MGAFSEMVKDEKNIKKFVDTSIEYLRKWKFDGFYKAHIITCIDLKYV